MVSVINMLQVILLLAYSKLPTGVVMVAQDIQMKCQIQETNKWEEKDTWKGEETEEEQILDEEDREGKWVTRKTTHIHHSYVAWFKFTMQYNNVTSLLLLSAFHHFIAIWMNINRKKLELDLQIFSQLHNGAPCQATHDALAQFSSNFHESFLIRDSLKLEIEQAYLPLSI